MSLDNQKITALPDAILNLLNSKATGNIRTNVHSITKHKNSNKQAFDNSESESPKADAQLIEKHCVWLNKCKEDASSLSEFDWFQALRFYTKCKNGRELAHDFSIPYPAYDVDETNTKFDNASGYEAPLTCAFLEENSAHGSASCKKCVYQGRIKTPLHLGLGGPLNYRFVYLMDQERYYDCETGCKYSNSAFKKAFAHIEHGFSNDQLMLKSKVTLKVEQQVYEPHRPAIMKLPHGRLELNVWKDPEIEPIKGDPSIFVDHVRYLFPDDYRFNIVMKFLAFCIQKEGEKIHYALIIAGQQGNGKSFLGRVLGWLLGAQNVSPVGNQELTSQFNPWAGDTSLILIEELMMGKRQDVANKLKTLITEPTIVINDKNEKLRTAHNKANIIAFTNYDVPIFLEKGDRRYCFADSLVEPRSEEYYNRLWDWTKQNLGVILHCLQEWDLTGFNPKSHAPYTEEKGRLLQETEELHKKCLRKDIENNIGVFHKDIICLDEFMRHDIEDVFCGKKVEVPHTIKGSKQKSGRLMKEMGMCKHSTVRYNDQGDKKNLWSIRNHEKWKNATERDLAAEYNRNSGSYLRQIT